MLVQEWDIASVQHTAPADSSSPEIESSLAKASDGYEDGDFPYVLLTSVAFLVDQQELSENVTEAFSPPMPRAISCQAISTITLLSSEELMTSSIC